MTAWRVALSLDVLLRQINELAPGRSIASDGSIGDAAHASRDSDHNPWCTGNVVTARDFTHDPDSGADMHVITESLRESRDERIKYVLWNHRMFSSYPTSTHPAWTWRPYSGINPHDKHAHVSVHCNASKDSDQEWEIGMDWDKLEKVVRRIVKEEVNEARVKLAVGKQDAYDADTVNLKKLLEKK